MILGALPTELVAYEPGVGFVLLGDLDKVSGGKALTAIRAGAQPERAGLVRLLR